MWQSVFSLRDGFLEWDSVRSCFTNKIFLVLFILNFLSCCFSPTLSSLERGLLCFILFSPRNVAFLDCHLEADALLILFFVVSALIFQDSPQYLFFPQGGLSRNDFSFFSSPLFHTASVLPWFPPLLSLVALRGCSEGSSAGNWCLFFCLQQFEVHSVLCLRLHCP